jgi:hypothetical protein
MRTPARRATSGALRHFANVLDHALDPLDKQINVSGMSSSGIGQRVV